jgi:hypothetical protein
VVVVLALTTVAVVRLEADILVVLISNRDARESVCLVLGDPFDVADIRCEAFSENFAPCVDFEDVAVQDLDVVGGSTAEWLVNVAVKK